jgi:hypothetical protein
VYEYRCDERLKVKGEGSTSLSYTGFHGGLEDLKIETRLNRREVSECDGSRARLRHRKDFFEVYCIKIFGPSHSQCFHFSKHVLSDVRYRKTCVLTLLLIDEKFAKTRLIDEKFANVMGEYVTER